MSTSLPAQPVRDLDRDTTPQPRALKARRVIIRVVYLLVSLLTFSMATGIVELLTGHIPNGPFGFGAGASTAWKLLSLGGYIVLAWTAGRSVPAAQWVLVGQATWLVADLVAPQDPTAAVPGTIFQYAATTLIFLGPWLVLAPERREIVHLRARPDRVALAVMIAVVVIAIVWAHHNAALVMPTIDEQSAEFRFDMVGLAVVLGSVGVFAALRPRGARWPLGCCAAACIYAGILSLVTATTDLANPGRAGALLLLASGVLLAWRARFTLDAVNARSA